MNIKECAIALVFIVLVGIIIGGTLKHLNAPRVYQDTKHKEVNVYCHGVFTDDGELVNETADNFTVEVLWDDNQYPKSVCKYVVTHIYYQ